MTRDNKSIVLFDVDGTLTASRKLVEPEILEMLRKLREKVHIAMVGGSDLVKQEEQLGKNVLEIFDYVFPENGLVSYKGTQLIEKSSLVQFLGEERLQELINFILIYIANLKIPVKRGTFIEFRAGMLNVSPIGRNCSQEERDEFEKYDHVHKIRETMVKALQERFPDYGLKYSIGGQISFDVFPLGWDKTYCLRYISQVTRNEINMDLSKVNNPEMYSNFENIYFFGDKTYPGGNDYEISIHPIVTSQTVTNPRDTLKFCTERFLNN